MEKNGKKSGGLKENRTKGNNSYSSFKTSLGDRTLTGDSRFNVLSPEKIDAKAKYLISLGSGEFSLANSFNSMGTLNLTSASDISTTYDKERAVDYSIRERRCSISEIFSTSTLSCFFNLFSWDQIIASSKSATAKKSMSSGSGEMSFASESLEAYSSRGTKRTTEERILVNSLNLDLLILARSIIQGLFVPNSIKAKEGERDTITRDNSIALIFEPFIKKEVRMLVSTAVNIYTYTNPSSLSFSNLPSFIFLPSSRASSSVSLLSLSSSLESFNISSLLHSWSTARSATMDNLFNDSSSTSGIFIFISPISTTNNNIGNDYYINTFSSPSTSNSTSCEDASQTCIMYSASCIRQTPIGVISKSQLPNPKHYAVLFLHRLYASVYGFYFTTELIQFWHEQPKL